MNFSSKEIETFLKKTRSQPFLKKITWYTIFITKSAFDFFKRRFKKMIKIKTKKNIVPESNSLWLGKCYKMLKDESSLLYFLSYENNDKVPIKKIQDKIENYNNFKKYDFDNLRPINYHIVNSTDCEYINQYHRFRDLLYLGKYLNISNDLNNNLIEFMKHSFSTWIDNNSDISKVGWASYNISERLVHWTWILQWLPKEVFKNDVEWSKSILKSINDQASYLYKNFEFNLGHHNHVINNARALLTVAICFPEMPNSNLWKKHSINVFENEWKYQILSDGAHSEQSLSYHFLITRTLWEFKQFYNILKKKFPFKNDLTKMISYATFFVRSDSTIPILGHITPDHPLKELIGLLPLWSDKIKNIKPSFLANIYSCAKNNQNDINEIKSEKILKIFQDSGIGIISSKHYQLTITNKVDGEIAFHGDQNLCGITLWHSNTDIIKDLGVNSYNLDERRKKEESWRGQSTFSVNSMDSIVSNWRKNQLPSGYFKFNSKLSKGNDFSISLKHNAYERLVENVKSERKVSKIDDKNFEVNDRLNSENKITYKSIFHFGGEIIKIENNNSILFQSTSSEIFWKFIWDDRLIFKNKISNYSDDYCDSKNCVSLEFDMYEKNINLIYSIQIL